MEEFMLRVSWSTNGHPDQTAGGSPRSEGGQPKHTRRGEVMLDLGIPFVPGDDFTADDMQTIARAAKMAALKIHRSRRSARRRG